MFYIANSLMKSVSRVYRYIMISTTTLCYAILLLYIHLDVFASTGIFFFQQPPHILWTTWVLYHDCRQPIDIKLSTDGEETTAIDAKFLLSGFFTLQQNSGYIAYSSWIFTYTTLPPLTGIITSWPYINQIYQYINAYQQLGTMTGINTQSWLIARMYLMPTSGYANGVIRRYLIPFAKQDDSTITVGTWIDPMWWITRILDIAGTGYDAFFIFSGGYGCPYRPFILSGEYNSAISDGSLTGKIQTGTIAGELFWYPANRYIRTNTSVVLTITWNESIQLLNSWVLSWIVNIQALTSGRNISHTLSISGNLSGILFFENQINNMGYTYQTGGNPYIYPFYVDVFWIDHTPPEATGVVGLTGMGFTEFTLSWSASWYANRTTDDDAFRIISFSGTNTTEVYNTITWYTEYLNNSWYVTSWTNIYSMTHTITFVESRSGYVLLIDRAGNTGRVFIDVYVTPYPKYGLIVYPHLRGDNSNFTGSRSGTLIKIAIYSSFNYQDFYGTQTVIYDNIVYTWRLKTSRTGFSAFTGFFSGTYDVLVEATTSLPKLLTGVVLTESWWLIDYTTLWVSGELILGNLYAIKDPLIPYAGAPTKQADYLAPQYTNNNRVYYQNIVRDRTINNNDLATFVSNRADFITYNESVAFNITGLRIFDTTFYPDIFMPGGAIITDKNVLQNMNYALGIMQYHPYDMNADGNINFVDYGIIGYSLRESGFILPF